MHIQPANRELMWMETGAVVLFTAAFLLLMYTQNEPSPAERLAFKIDRADRVARMRLTLVSASEAEKSAVLAVTDEESRTFADQARTAAAELERERSGLETLLASADLPGEQALLAKFSNFFQDFKQIDTDLLDLAVKNTNLKAAALAFGPAADELGRMDGALSRLAAKVAVSPQAGPAMPLACGAQAAALRIQTLLAPHIAEENDGKMDELEARMSGEDRIVRGDLDGLAALPELRGDPDLGTAASAYARYGETRSRILALSRENTNVHSLSLSLGRKRKALALCQDALITLQEAIQAEPIAGVNLGPSSNPRHMGVGEPETGK